MKMSYEYDTYGNYPPYEYAQPPPELDIHPNLAAAQLGLTPEQIRGVSEEQERWFREEYQQELEEDRLHRARVSTEYQEQDHEARWVPTPPISNSDPTPQAYEPPETATSLDNNDVIDRGDIPTTRYHPPTPITNALHPPLPPNDGTYKMTGECDEHVATAVDNVFDANTEPEHDSVIERLARELIASDNAMGSWSEEM